MLSSPCHLVEYVRDDDCMHVTGFYIGTCQMPNVIVVRWIGLKGEGESQNVLLLPETALEIGKALLMHSASGTKQ